VFEALELTRWYAREHVILCLLPAFWIAGAIAAFFSKQAVMKYLGPGAPKVASYGVASVSGTILAVCSCTVLPLFSGIYRMGAGLGPATAFLYSGPAINALAIILTAKILGWEIGLARAVGAVFFALVVGALMAWIVPQRRPNRKIPQGGGCRQRTRRGPCGRRPRSSRCWWAFWCSPTGAATMAPASSPPCMR
jgi:uncharacterized protein